MGVYIPNIKKPKHCTECYFVSRDQCELQDNSYDYDTFKEQRKHCPLVEIDDELFQKAENAYALQQIKSKERRVDERTTE